MISIGLVAVALIVGFLLPVVWWRVRGPSLSSVLLLFTLFYVLLSVAVLHWDLISVGAADYARLTLLYVSLVLGYTIVCSAVEASSPTLGIIEHLAKRGRDGCPESELMQRFLDQDSAWDRIKLMEVGPLVRIEAGRCTLTNKGLLLARLFQLAAQFFGLPQGG
jgi:hypothetical protein